MHSRIRASKCILQKRATRVRNDEIGDSNYPALDLGEDGRVKTALQEKVFVAWLAAAQRVAFGTLTRLAADKRAHHARAVVTRRALTPLAGSAGGGMFPRTTTGCRARRYQRCTQACLLRHTLMVSQHIAEATRG